jgi:serine palmitoyltransferase
LNSPTGPKCRLSTGRTVTNLASYNFYNFIANENIKEKAIQTLRTYGVGPCGPPGFYGTQDVHMKTEADIASFLGTAACIVYAQAFSTISSVIPAFSKRGDIIVADKECNYAIKKGIQISRSTVRWFEHNDMEDLEKVLKKVTREQRGKPLTRRFIVTEGLFETVGDALDLPKIVGSIFLLYLILWKHVPVLTMHRSNSSSATNSASSSMKHGPSASWAAPAAVSPSTRTSTLPKST